MRGIYWNMFLIFTLYIMAQKKRTATKKAVETNNTTIETTTPSIIPVTQPTTQEPVKEASQPQLIKVGNAEYNMDTYIRELEQNFEGWLASTPFSEKQKNEERKALPIFIEGLRKGTITPREGGGWIDSSYTLHNAKGFDKWGYLASFATEGLRAQKAYKDPSIIEKRELEEYNPETRLGFLKSKIVGDSIDAFIQLDDWADKKKTKRNTINRANQFRTGLTDFINNPDKYIKFKYEGDKEEALGLANIILNDVLKDNKISPNELYYLSKAGFGDVSQLFGDSLIGDNSSSVSEKTQATASEVQTPQVDNTAAPTSDSTSTPTTAPTATSNTPSVQTSPITLDTLKQAYPFNKLKSSVILHNITTWSIRNKWINTFEKNKYKDIGKGIFEWYYTGASKILNNLLSGTLKRPQDAVFTALERMVATQNPNLEAIGGNTNAYVIKNTVRSDRQSKKPTSILVYYKDINRIVECPIYFSPTWRNALMKSFKQGGVLYAKLGIPLTYPWWEYNPLDATIPFNSTTESNTDFSSQQKSSRYNLIDNRPPRQRESASDYNNRIEYEDYFKQQQDVLDNYISPSEQQLKRSMQMPEQVSIDAARTFKENSFRDMYNNMKWANENISNDKNWRQTARYKSGNLGNFGRTKNGSLKTNLDDFYRLDANGKRQLWDTSWMETDGKFNANKALAYFNNLTGSDASRLVGNPGQNPNIKLRPIRWKPYTEGYMYNLDKNKHLYTFDKPFDGDEAYGGDFLDEDSFKAWAKQSSEQGYAGIYYSKSDGKWYRSKNNSLKDKLYDPKNVVIENNNFKTRKDEEQNDYGPTRTEQFAKFFVPLSMDIAGAIQTIQSNKNSLEKLKAAMHPNYVSNPNEIYKPLTENFVAKEQGNQAGINIENRASDIAESQSDIRLGTATRMQGAVQKATNDLGVSVNTANDLRNQIEKNYTIKQAQADNRAKNADHNRSEDNRVELAKATANAENDKMTTTIIGNLIAKASKMFGEDIANTVEKKEQLKELSYRLFAKEWLDAMSIKEKESWKSQHPELTDADWYVSAEYKNLLNEYQRRANFGPAFFDHQPTAKWPYTQVAKHGGVLSLNSRLLLNKIVK